jgi:hypothetical protein
VGEDRLPHLDAEARRGRRRAEQGLGDVVIRPPDVEEAAEEVRGRRQRHAGDAQPGVVPREVVVAVDAPRLLLDTAAQALGVAVVEEKDADLHVEEALLRRARSTRRQTLTHPRYQRRQPSPDAQPVFAGGGPLASRNPHRAFVDVLRAQRRALGHGALGAERVDGGEAHHRLREGSVERIEEA